MPANGLLGHLPAAARVVPAPPRPASRKDAGNSE
jgi:hypothetical protein